MENQISHSKMPVKRIFILVSMALAVVALVLLMVLPTIKIDPSYAGNELIASKKGNYDVLVGWSYLIGFFSLMFGGGTYDAYVINPKVSQYDLTLQQDKMSFNPMVLIGFIILIVTIVAQFICFLLHKKSLLISRLFLAGYIVAAIMIILSAVWFYAMNPIVESNYYDSVTKLDSAYKYVNGHLAPAPIIATVLLVGSAIFTTVGE